MPNKRDPNKVSVSDYWPKEFHAAFKTMCQSKGITMADGLKEACAEWLERHEKSRKKPKS